MKVNVDYNLYLIWLLYSHTVTWYLLGGFQVKSHELKYSLYYEQGSIIGRLFLGGNNDRIKNIG